MMHANAIVTLVEPGSMSEIISIAGLFFVFGLMAGTVFGIHWGGFK